MSGVDKEALKKLSNNLRLQPWQDFHVIYSAGPAMLPVHIDIANEVNEYKPGMVQAAIRANDAILKMMNT